MSHDVIVIGLGGMGSAAAATLAARGQRVLGIDQFHPPHDLGSSHGRSRIIRLAYKEAPEYVPLLRRAYELWQELAGTTSDRVLLQTGGLMLGTPDSSTVAGALASAQQHDLPYEMLDARGIRAHFPAFRPPPHHVGVFDELAGVLMPETAVQLQLRRAVAHGADLLLDTRVDSWESRGDVVRVRAAARTHEAGSLVLTAGAWLPSLGISVSPRMRVARQVMHWFEPPGGIEPFLPGRFPVYMWEVDGGPEFYGFPALDGPGGGVKAAIHHGGQETTADGVDRQIHAADRAAMQACVAARIPGLAGPIAQSTVCLYTNTPDLHFVLGGLAEQPNVVLAGGLSGHGFKFATVIGEVLADLATTGSSPLPIAPFAPDRFD